jgi:hypothetical protein
MVLPLTTGGPGVTQDTGGVVVIVMALPFLRTCFEIEKKVVVKGGTGSASAAFATHRTEPN